MCVLDWPARSPMVFTKMVLLKSAVFNGLTVLVVRMLVGALKVWWLLLVVLVWRCCQDAGQGCCAL